jgi:predicted O-linked N-acetylglucosamine transferase (SPINDLY family)
MSDLEAAKRLFLEALGFLDTQDYGSAEARLRDALTHAPRSVSILANLSVALAQQGRPDEALAFAEQAIDIAPDNVEALLVAANCYIQSKHYGAALAACDKIIAVEPRLAEIHNNRAIALKGLHRYAESLASCDRAIALQPRFAGAHGNRATALTHLGRHDEALRACDDALRLDPDLAEALVTRGNVHVQLGRHDAAFADFDTAFARKPELNYLEGDRLHARMHVCDWRDFDRDCAHLVSAINASTAASTPFPLLAVPSTPQDQRACAALYAIDQAREAGAPLRRSEPYSHERMRVAYLSADLREHPLAYLMAGVFDRHDRSQFEITAISFGPPDDSPMRRRLTAAFDRFVDVGARSDRECRV